MLTELAGLGPLGLEALEGAPRHVDEDTLAAELEGALDLAAAGWTEPGAGPAVTTDGLPTAAQLAALRRRFHELGAGNPFAVAGVRRAARTARDASTASAPTWKRRSVNTRELIAALSALISEQFRTTFAALEEAFERRFHELFGGGDAELSLTIPTTSRPPASRSTPDRRARSASRCRCSRAASVP